MTSPQRTHRYTRSPSVRSTVRLPQPEQSCDVCAGFTAMTSHSLTMRRLCWCAKSSRFQRVRSCVRATPLRRFWRCLQAARSSAFWLTACQRSTASSSGCACFMRSVTAGTCSLVGIQRQLPLRPRPFFTPKEAWVGEGLPIGAAGEGRPPHIDAHLPPSGRQWYRLPLTRHGHEPFSRRRAADGRRLGRPFERAMGDEFHIAHFRQQQTFAAAAECDAVVPLRIGQRILSSRAAKARIAWRLARLEPTKVGVHRLL